MAARARTRHTRLTERSGSNAAEELDLAELEASPDKAAIHLRRANKFQDFADREVPSDIPPDSDVS
jgi:hypothetical protein